MRRQPFTPCPVLDDQQTLFDDKYNEETTSNLDYTTAFDASFRRVPARRPPRARLPPAIFAIHEDEDLECAKDTPKLLTTFRGSRCIAVGQNAGKRRADIESKHGSTPEHDKKCSSRSNEPEFKMPKCCASPQSNAERLNIKNQLLSIPPNKLTQRTARRGTVLAPSEANVLPANHMNVFSPIKPEGQVCTSIKSSREIVSRFTKEKASPSPPRTTKTRRVPLASNTAHRSMNVYSPDRPGAPTGKENLVLNPIRGGIVREQKCEKGKPTLQSTSNAKKQRDPNDLKNAIKARKAALRSQGQSEVSETIDMIYNIPPPVVSPKSVKRKPLPQPAEEAKYKNQIFISVSPVNETRGSCSFIDGIDGPHMYDSTWLDDHEVVITELANQILDRVERRSTQEDYDKLRSELLAKYTDPNMNLLYNRVQASTLYGTLGLTYEGIMHMQSLSTDVGRRRRFLDFWLSTYDIELLRTAVEVVTGRAVSSNARISLLKRVEYHIEAFFLQHREQAFKSVGSGSVTDLGSKTVLKCLMLVKALDMLKGSSPPLTESCLFQSSSHLKSSKAVLKTILQMLNPAVGNAVRTLRHLGFVVDHVQESFDNVSYHINNMAIDLRDGIRLARIVELVHADVAAGLTKGLVYPAPSRAVRVSNVARVLNVLSNKEQVSRIVEDSSAQDIVDGNQEETISIIWDLLNTDGINHLLDKRDIQQELRRMNYPQSTSGDISTTLKDWAHAVAATAKIRIGDNYCTDFANGRVFLAILDRYEPYFDVTRERLSKISLADRLIRLGFSQQFAATISRCKSGRGRLLSQHTIVATLACLYSRCVAPTTNIRNAVTIQRAWRAYRTRIETRQKVIKRSLAQEIAAVVCSKRDTKPTTAVNTTDLDRPDKANTEILNDVWLSL